jgi:hypothetical protein
MRLIRSPIACASILLALSACARHPSSLPPPIPLASSEIAGVLSELEAQEDGIRRAQGIVGARGRGPEGGFDARLVMIFERPNRLRVELMGAFGGTRWSAVASGGKILVYFPGEKQYLEEPDASDVVARLLGLRLDPSEVMAILAGVGVPLVQGTAASGERRGASSILTIEGSGERLELSADGQVVRAFAASYRVSYPTTWKSHGRQIPDEVVIENDEIKTTLTTGDLDVNVALDPEAFAIGIPVDAVRLRPAEVEGRSVFVVQPKERKRWDDTDLYRP